MDIKVFTTPGCSYCVKIKELMERAGVEYTQTTVGKDLDMSVDEFKSEYPIARGFPHVIIDGRTIGGLVETVKYFVEKGLVSSKKVDGN